MLPACSWPVRGGSVLESLLQEHLPPVAQLPVGALDFPEEPGQVLIARLLGVPEVGRARLRPLQGVIEDADDIVMLVFGTGRTFTHGHLPLCQGLGASLAFLPEA